MSLLQTLYKRTFYSPYKNFERAGGSLGTGTVLNKDFEVIHYGSRGQVLSIGKDCLLSGSVIFESPQGALSIGNGTFIGGNTKLISINSIQIGDHVTIAWGVTIYDHNSHSLSHEERILDQQRQLLDLKTGNFVSSKDWSVVKSAPIAIGNHAWIGFDAVILKGVNIGEGAVVAARAVVSKDVEPWTVVAGNPAQIVKRLR